MNSKSTLVIGLAIVASVFLVCATLIYINQGQIAQAPKPVIEDVAHRYEFKDFRHGNMVGLALLDKQIGRAWVLTQINDEKGKKVRNEFKELAVEDLWQVDEDYWAILGGPGVDAKDVLEMQRYLRSVKDAARTKIVLAAEAEAASLKLKFDQARSKAIPGAKDGKR